MITKLDGSAGNALGFKISGTVKKDDYTILVPEVEALVAKEVDVRLLLDMTEFKWEAIGAWGADMKFGHDYRKKITRMALVGDKRWEKWLTKVAAPFFAGEAEFFPSAEVDAAWAWVRED